ncbi:RDD family protein, partial [Cellulomonas oligotrophica]
DRPQPDAVAAPPSLPPRPDAAPALASPPPPAAPAPPPPGGRAESPAVAPVAPQDVPTIGSRLLAHTVDVLVLLAAFSAGVLVVLVVGDAAAFLTWLLPVVALLGQIAFEGLRGRTLGALMVGLLTLDARTGRVPGWRAAAVRQLVLAAGGLGLLVGTWVVAGSGAWDRTPAQRGWHDKASGTVVRRSAAVRRAAMAAKAAAAASAAPPAQAAAGPAEQVPDAQEPDAREQATHEQVAPAASGPGAGAGPVVGAPGAGPRPAEQPDDDVTVRTPPAGGAAAARPAPDRLIDSPAWLQAAGRTEAARGTGHDAARGTWSPVGGVPASFPPSVAPADEVDDDLVDLEHTRVADPAQLRRRTSALTLLFDTGQRVRVAGRGLVGRKPSAGDGRDILHVVAIDDPSRSVSRVHLEFGPVAAPGSDASTAPAELWVLDRGSTNGTVVVDPDGEARVLPPGARAVVGPGWQVRMGERVIQVDDD